MLLRALVIHKCRYFRAFNCIETISLKSKNIFNYIGSNIVEDVIDENTGEIFIEGGFELDKTLNRELRKAKIKTLDLVNTNKNFHSMMLMEYYGKRPSKNTEEALNIVYQLLGRRTSKFRDSPKFIERIFFNPKKYDLGEVGRYRLNQQFGLKVPVEDTVLTMDDITQVVNFLVEMRKGERGSRY